MTRDARVDVGIPVSGRDDYIAQAIESVLAQTSTSWTLVVSEDGPPSEAVHRAVETYLADPRVTLTGSGTRLGAPRHMTRIVAGGTSTYFALLHDDDLWDPEFLERRISFLEQHPECGYVFSPVRIIDGEGRELEQMPVWFEPGVQTSVDMVSRLLEGNVVPSPAVVVRRAVYERVGGSFDAQLNRIYDFELWFRLAISAPVGFLATHDAAWRSHPEQSTKSVADRQREFRVFLARARANLAGSPHASLSLPHARRILALWSLSNALDAAEQGSRRISVANLRVALRAHPPVVLDPRVAALALSLPFGRSGARVLRLLRTEIRQRDLDVHVLTRRRPTP